MILTCVFIMMDYAFIILKEKNMDKSIVKFLGFVPGGTCNYNAGIV